MRKARIIGAAVALAVALIAALAPPAAAYPTVWQTQPWHQGRLKTNWYAPWQFATSGPWYYGANGKFYQAETRHQHVGSSGFGSCCTFLSVYESAQTDKYDGNSVLYPSLPQYDIILVEGGANSVARSDYVYDYCNGWNCSSEFGGGTANNPAWSGSWRNMAGFYSSNIPGGLALSQSGARSGTSTGTSNGTVQFNSSYGYHWRVQSLGQCGTGEGDSGAPVYLKGSNGTAYLAGMSFAGVNPVAAGAGNSCYNQGALYATELAFYNNDTIRVLFQSQTGGNLTPLT